MIQDLKMLALLEDMESITKSILQVSLEEEEKEPVILSLQDKQVELRNEIQGIFMTEQRSYSEEELLILRSCFELEKQISSKFNTVLRDSNEHLERLSSGKRTRAVYQHEEIQHMGYFIDKQQ